MNRPQGNMGWGQGGWGGAPYGYGGPGPGWGGGPPGWGQQGFAGPRGPFPYGGYGGPRMFNNFQGSVATRTPLRLLGRSNGLLYDFVATFGVKTGQFTRYCVAN